MNELDSLVASAQALFAQSNTPASEKKQVWLIARQHPGETMAEWFVEGLLERLLDQADAVSRTLLQQCVFYVVPNMNPDGAVALRAVTPAVN